MPKPREPKEFLEEQKKASHAGHGVDDVFRTLTRDHFTVKFRLSTPTLLPDSKRLRKKRK